MLKSQKLLAIIGGYGVCVCNQRLRHANNTVWNHHRHDVPIYRQPDDQMSAAKAELGQDQLTHAVDGQSPNYKARRTA